MTQYVWQSCPDARAACHTLYEHAFVIILGCEGAFMSKIYVPSKGPDDWQRFLAQPDKQWQTGFSAKTLAHCWEGADGLPKEIEFMLRSLGSDVELLLAIPEHKVPLPGSSRGESQNDVFALVRAGGRTFAIMIEGKVNEAFGDTIGDWLKDASDGKRERL